MNDSASVSVNYYKIVLEVCKLILLLPKTDRLQQVEDYVRGCTWLLKRVENYLQVWQVCFGKLTIDLLNEGSKYSTEPKSINWKHNI